MSSTAPDASTQFKINPKTLKYLKRTFDIVDRAITQADIVFPTSRWPAYDGKEYSEFREKSFWKLDGEIRKCDPKVSDGLIDLIIVEVEQAISVLVAIRKHGIDGEVDRFNKAEAILKKLVNNLNSAIEIVSEISKDTSLSKMLMDALRGFRRDADLFFRHYTDIPEYDSNLVRDIVDEAKPMLYIMATLIRVNSPLLQLKIDLADSKLIRLRRNTDVLVR